MTKTPRAATEDRHGALRDALVIAADHRIAADGLHALRARTLAEAAGCSVGAIYTVFPDLDALVLAVNARTLAAIDRAMAAVAPVADAAAHLERLAEAYLDYAAGARQRWAALFQHSMADGKSAPGWYAEQQEAAFSHIEAPLAALRPDLPPAERALLARSLFAAVHGMVALGLDEKIVTMPLDLLRQQVRLVVAAIARGLVRR